ncbi:hypothetical protein ACWCQ0_00765 [Streptomyces massasporeus]|uniref:hypothetical protein n=1 Tax=Streptomyces massasporeus TaxID=67324 RepID=UPI0033E30A7E
MTTPGPRLEEITPADLDAALGIRVRPDQEHAVAPVVKSLAEAYVHHGVTWHPGPDGPERFYLGLGFCPNGETSGGETVGVLELDGDPAGAPR